MSDTNAKRDTSRDGSANKRELFLLTKFGPVWRWAQKVKPIEKLLNRAIINSGIDKVDARPYRLSTKAPITSWDSLTDRNYNTRSLPRAPQDGLPDVAEVAKLFERKEEIPCEKSTVLFAYTAQWFTDGFLRSVRHEERDPPPPEGSPPRDITRNVSTHEVDLAQLYGMRNEITDMLRTPRKDGDGLMKFETIGDEEFPPFLCKGGQIRPEFAVVDPAAPGGLKPLGFDKLPDAQKDRLFAMGSDSSNAQIGYAMLNVLFLREHNRIAKELANTYAKSLPADPKERSDWLFGVARNVLTALLIKVVIQEYINHITPYHFQFRMDPNGFDKAKWMRPNWVAVEFNLLYRWHSLIPSKLVAGPGKSIELSKTMFQMQLLTEHGLGRLIQDASGQHAGRVGLCNTDPWLLPITDEPSIREGREVELARYNAYREYCKFPPVTDFDQITSDPQIRSMLKDVYGKVDNIELFVGLFAEERRTNSVLPPMVGRLVGLHAFSQLMTNPLLAPAIYNHPDTFTDLGRRTIVETNSLAELLNRNVPGDERYEARLTHADWRRR